ncbi:TonB-linked outer membrane protein, SusC/RagA family [Flavobacterium gillisiae]|uniref:TonB-linked outer membrane protein, SusC/RagA family n=2 Tax=Bacteria TaxID=2 RepID=A0A1H4FXU1_9FLAO|nr:SusC/RagA family TonB-linked outer membrane protein [Flavobacterium gillisiae]SEB02169.1 TonB-linked outer membrane protein, SusC/RagA family [Flavobacterium gillisiae]
MKNNSFYKGRLAFWCLIVFGFLISYTPALSKTALKPIQYSPQQNQISGTITDGTGPLVGVTITIKGQQKGAISDFDGKFTINALPNDMLIFSFMGFKTLTIPVDGHSILAIRMQEDATSLQEVKINAGYYSVKESERTGSIAKITAKDIEKQPVTNPLAAMQGRMSGVNITQATGVPGGGFTIQIRGINSIRAEGNEPLYIVDGVPYSSQSLGFSSASSGILAGTTSPLNGINPSDLESIEVLKDADATAIYGSRGANGVVLITTKKGKAGKTKFNLNAYSSFGTLTRTLDLMHTDQYLSMRREAFSNDGITTYPGYAYDVNGKWDQTRYTNWQKELIGGTATTNNLQATLSGGSSGTQYLISGTMHKETTVFPGDAKYGKGALHTNLTHRTEDGRFKINFSANYTADKNILPPSDFTYKAAVLAPNAPALYDANGNLNWEKNSWTNPLATLNGRYTGTTAALIANTLLSYQILEGLELKTNLSYTDNRVEESRINPSTMYNPAFGIGSERSTLYLNNASSHSWTIEPQLNWLKKIGKSEINILAGATFQDQKSSQLAQTGSGFPSNGLIYNLAAASRLSISSNTFSEYKYQAFFGRINFNYKSKYILNATGRRDGSSRFGPGNRFANFAAVGAAWVFSKESFLDTSTFLSFGKLRASYGTSGNDQIGDYQFLDTYDVTGNNYNGIIGLQPSRLFNPNFAWETNKKLEIAIELGFVNDRVFLSTAYYRNRSSNQLVGIPLAGTTGFSSLQANLNATVQNSGLELELRVEPFRSKNFNWTSDVNLSLPKNKLLEFPNLESSPYANRYLIGQSISIQKVYHYTGINPQTGLYSFEDYDSDGQISSPNDQQWIEDTAPKWFGGFANQLSYKNWSMDFLFQFVKQKARNYLYNTSWAGDMVNQPVAIGNHWPLDGLNSQTQLYTTGENGEALDAWSSYSNSSATISDASYIRLKSLSLSYTIPTKGSAISTARVYLQAQNLLTFTNYKGADPENQSSFFIAPLRQISLGVQLGL